MRLIHCGTENSPAQMSRQQASSLGAELLSTERTVNYHESTALIFSRHFNQFELEILHRSSGSLLSEAACSSLEPFSSLTALFKSPIVSTVQYLLWNLQAQVLDREGHWLVSWDIPS